MLVPVLRSIHMGFFGQIGDLERFVEAEPERLPEAIRIYQKEVMKGVRIAQDILDPSFTGIQKYMRWAAACGAEVVEESDRTNKETHLLTTNGTSERSRRAFRAGSVLVVHPMWIQACCAAWRRVDEEHFFVEQFAPDESGCWARLKYLYPPGSWSVMKTAQALAEAKSQRRAAREEKRRRATADAGFDEQMASGEPDLKAVKLLGMEEAEPVG